MSSSAASGSNCIETIERLYLQGCSEAPCMLIRSGAETVPANQATRRLTGESPEQLTAPSTPVRRKRDDCS